MSVGTAGVKYCQKCGRPSPAAAVMCARCGDVNFGPAPPADGVEQYYQKERRVGVYRMINAAFAVVVVIFGILMLALFYSVFPSYGNWTYAAIVLALAATGLFAWIGSRFLDRVYVWLTSGRG